MSEEGQSLHHLLEHIDPVKEAFPILRKWLMIGMTLGTSTETVEHTFSSLRRLKTYVTQYLMI